MKFKVGDIVTSVSETPYSVTTSDAVMRVVGAAGAFILVTILKHSARPDQIGRCYTCYSNFFKPYKLLKRRLQCNSKKVQP